MSIKTQVQIRNKEQFINRLDLLIEATNKRISAEEHALHSFLRQREDTILQLNELMMEVKNG